MSVVGAFCVVWREARYLPLVLEQLERVPGPVLVLHCDRPFFWTADTSEPCGHASKVAKILDDWRNRLGRSSIEVRVDAPADERLLDSVRHPWAKFPSLQILKLTGHWSTETLLRNYATKGLREMGADVALWHDSDMLVDLPEFDRLMETMAADEPRCWTVKARHLWRNWQTTYSRGNFRMGYPTAATWIDGSFDRKFEETAKHADVMVWHPSYVLSDQEVHDKISSWFHAPLAKEAKWWERWQSRDWDREQDLQPLDIPVPAGIQKRLERHGCLEGL